MANFIIKSLAFLDICTAVVVIIFQISTLVRYSSNPETGDLEKVAAGIWAGISFMITGIVFWRSAHKGKLERVYNQWEVATALISFFCSIALIGVMAANIEAIEEDWYCLYRYIPKDHCTVQHALDGVMLFGGCFACVINGALSFISCYCYN
ncbi:uncharacterized protein LOC130701534 [Daphnia carinata]|uniref:uncharacterized protein LOC130701534 n=1 Tax=Daphnia carinata TaxID=120202 RepID=UPI00257FBA74|nr:uncharacterized protein LOC130701534 [Daphnia carinata]